MILQSLGFGSSSEILNMLHIRLLKTNDTLLNYREGYPSIKSYNSLYTCSCEVPWQIQNIIYLLLQGVHSRNVAERSFTLKGIMRHREITWQIKNVISPLPQYLKRPNLAAWWFSVMGFQPQSPIKILKLLFLWEHVINQTSYSQKTYDYQTT